MSNAIMVTVEKNIHRYLDGTPYSVSEDDRKQGKEAYFISISVNGNRKTKRIIGTLEEARQVLFILKNEDKIRKVERATRKPVISQKKEHDTQACWLLGHAIEKTINLHWTNTSGGTNASRNARQAGKFFGENTPLDNISLENVDDYVDYLRVNGNSEGTINRKLSALSKVFSTAYERGKCTHKLHMPRMKEAIHRVRFLTQEEEAILLNVLNKLGYTDHAEAVMILLYTGFRCSELWRLDCKDIDLEKRTITLWKTKNGRPRTVPIVDCIFPVIKRRVDAVNGIGKIFQSASNDWLRNAWFRARELMGMDKDPQFVPHMLRHTTATRLARKGVSMTIIKEWLGHASIATTSRYTHFSPNDLVSAGKLLSSDDDE